MKSASPIPRPALVLGWLGVLPFAAFTLFLATGAILPRASAIGGLIGYGEIILSFMGGVHWGLAITATHASTGVSAGRLAISVLPALAAFGVSFLPPIPALIVLAAAFLVLDLYDFAAARSGAAPGWYPALRTQLTGAVVCCLTIAQYVGRG